MPEVGFGFLALIAVMQGILTFCTWHRRACQKLFQAYTDYDQFMAWHERNQHLPVRYSVKGMMLIDRAIQSMQHAEWPAQLLGHTQLFKLRMYELYRLKFSWPDRDPPSTTDSQPGSPFSF
jgi:hypothetical protein